MNWSLSKCDGRKIKAKTVVVVAVVVIVVVAVVVVVVTISLNGLFINMKEMSKSPVDDCILIRYSSLIFPEVQFHKIAISYLDFKIPNEKMKVLGFHNLFTM